MSVATHELLHVPHALGAQEDALAAVRDERAQSRGTLVGTWAAETGVLNRVIALWSQPGSGASVSTTGEDDWHSSGVVRRTLVARRAVDEDVLRAPFAELRLYVPHPGQFETFVGAMLAALPHRERFSPCAGVWSTRERGHDVVVHLWGYRTFDERVTARNAAAGNESWSAYRAFIRPLLASMRSTLLIKVAV